MGERYTLHWAIRVLWPHILSALGCRREWTWEDVHIGVCEPLQPWLRAAVAGKAVECSGSLGTVVYIVVLH